MNNYLKYTSANPLRPYDYKTPCNWLGTAIGALGGIASNIIGNNSVSSANKANLQIARETNAYNRQMMYEQFGLNRRMWNEMNAYNTPLAQAQRFRDAGLNPYLMMSQGANAGNATSAQNVSAANGVTATMQPFHNSLGEVSNSIASNYAMLQTLKNQTTKNKAEVNNLNAETYSKLIDNQYSKYHHETNLQTELFKLGLLKDTRDYQIESQRLNNELLEAEKLKKFAERNKIIVDTELGKTELRFLPTQQKTDLAEKLANIQLLYYKGELTQKQAKLAVQQAAREKAAAYGIDLSNQMTDSLFDKTIYYEQQRMGKSLLEQDARIVRDYNSGLKSRYDATRYKNPFEAVSVMGNLLSDQLNGTYKYYY